MAAACIKTSLSASQLTAPANSSFDRNGSSAPQPITFLQARSAVPSCRQLCSANKRPAGLGLGAIGGLRSDPSELNRFRPLQRRCRPVSAARVTAAIPFLPPAFGYVALTAAASLMLVQWQMFQVAQQRRKSGVVYPAIYEDKEDSVFNCYQRAHQNTLESYPAFLAFLLLSGSAYPITASVLGAVWIIGRLFYSLGYYTGNPNNRHRGSFHWFAFWGLGIASIVLGVKQLRYLPA
ncbi:glutathione S-transferase [Klebsormidium nitens]|uniref:Glutathione S-transferase 3, mitochondrial n=1 Tax=Klebsormidium nitens TaxID=105231 RepID=A0A1Y1IKF7_KLENI|nr:glutathione S-transferase [Klebsormidium nitens]|eukprot:GAQ88578.1 glutathione S-transferase [Klebsormidium nitens]